MSIRSTMLAVAFTLAAPTLNPIIAQGRAGSDSAQIVAVLTAIYAAQARNDMASLDTLYAGDALTVIEGASINRGWKDFRDHHLGPELSEQKNFQVTPSDVEVHVTGGTAWTIFRYASKYDLPSRSVDAIGRGTAVFERVNGKWKLRHYHASGRARRPTDPPGE